METPAIEVTEVETLVEKTMSLNHSPSIKAVHLFLPGQPVSIVTSGMFHDPASQVSLSIDAIFH